LFGRKWARSRPSSLGGAVSFVRLARLCGHTVCVYRLRVPPPRAQQHNGQAAAAGLLCFVHFSQQPRYCCWLCGRSCWWLLAARRKREAPSAGLGDVAVWDARGCPLQDIVLLLGRLCTSQSSFHSFDPPALPTLLQYYCTAIGHNIRPLLDLPLAFGMPHTIQYIYII